jgi:hypothetical protein
MSREDYSMNTKPQSWRDRITVHPAADLFPMLPEDKLVELGQDIKKNGLQELVAIWSDPARGPVVVDGRNRLDAMERVGMEVVTATGEFKDDIFGRITGSDDHKDIVSYIISKNIHRRHLTKEQAADLIVQAMKAQTDLAKTARSVKRDENGRVNGTTKDTFKEKVVEEAKKHGISKRTAEKAIAKDKGPTLPPRKTPAQPQEQREESKKPAPQPPKPASEPRVNAAEKVSAVESQAPPPEPIAVLKSAEKEPEFRGANTYKVTFTLDGARVTSVKKKILQLFPDSSADLTVENAFRHETRGEKLQQAKSIVEELRDGLQEWRDNLPENFQFGDKADEIDECINSLESIISEMDGIEFPSAFGN